MRINISPQQFRQTDFSAQVGHTIFSTLIGASQIELELTESTIIDNIDHTVAAMGQLRKLDVQFSIDDFGTGYSSLNFLKQLPVSILKVDQSFIQEISDDTDIWTVVRTIMAMAE